MPDKKEEPVVIELTQVPVYRRLSPEVLSEEDEIAIVLKVRDWINIKDGLYDDADAEGIGPAVHAVHQAGLIEMGLDWWTRSGLDKQDGERLDNAYGHDYERTHAHECQAGTTRCADTIDEVLKRYGWTE